MTPNLTRLAKIVRRFPREPNPHSDLAKINHEDLNGARILLHMYGEQHPDLAELLELIAKAKERALQLSGEPNTTATALCEAVGVVHDLQMATIIAMNPVNLPIPEVTNNAVNDVFTGIKEFREACLTAAGNDRMKGYALNYAEAAHPRRYGCEVDSCPSDDTCEHEMWRSRRMKRIERELGLRPDDDEPEVIEQF